MAKQKGWRPLQRASAFQRITDEDQNEAAARAALEAGVDNTEYWINDIYQVARRPLANEAGTIIAIHLCIRRLDGKVIFRDWRHFQWIKNQLVGEECEGLELYPAESRLNDTSNKYHLWVYTDPTYRIPVGMPNRNLQDDDGNRHPGYRQRKLPKNRVGRTGPEFTLLEKRRP